MAGRGMVFWLTTFSFAIFIKVSKEQHEGCLEQSLVGKGNLNISDRNYKASSQFGYRYTPHQAKLNGKYGWAAKSNNDPDDYLQIDLDTPSNIIAVATQGNGGDPDDQHHKTKNEWVEKYNLRFSNNNKTWIKYEHTINGNWDSNTVKRYDFQAPIRAQYIQFIPVAYHGHKTMRVNIYVFNKLQDAPHDVTVSPGNRSIRLNWKIKPCRFLNITGYKIKLNGKKVSNVSHNKNSYQLKGLKPYTKYSVSVKAEIQQGDGIWSKVISTRTKIEKPAAFPKITSMKAASSDSIIIKLKKPDRDKIYGPFEGYEIQYAPKGAGKKTVENVDNVTTHTLKQLIKYTNYSIILAIRNKDFTGPHSREWIVETMEDAPSAPVNLNALLKPANGLVRSRVVITWERPIPTNGIIRKYTIVYYLNNDINAAKRKTVTIKEGTKTPLECTITMMFCGTFSYRISAFTIKEGLNATGTSITIPEYKCPEKSLAGGKGRNLIIPNSSYTASSYYNDGYAPHQAKLYGPYGWAPKSQNNRTDYLQIDLGTTYVITAVATQGSGGNIASNEWVKRYKLEYSSSKLKWSSYKNNNYEFKGNTDSSSVVRYDLEDAISARYIKFIPTDYHGKKTMRVNVYVSFQEAPRVTKVVAGQRLVELSWTVKPCSPTHPIKGYVVRLENKTGIYQVNSSGMACSVTDLKPYTEYNVSVRAIKEVGYGRWSNVTTTRTAIAEPEAVPVITNIEAKHLQSITIEWKLERPDLIHGPFKGYLIRYTTQGDTEKKFVACEVVTTCTTHTLTSLLKYTTYSVDIAVENEKYTSQPSSSRSIRTKIDTPDDPPIITRIQPQSSQSIALDWKKVDSDDINGNFQAYRITYTAEGGEADTLDVGDVTTHTLTSLLKYTMYSVSIAVMNEKFVGPPSAVVTERTLEDAPSAPLNVNGSLLPANGSIPPRVVITWDRPRHPNGIIKKYTIVYYYSKDASNKKTVNIKGTNDLQYTMNFTNNGVLLFKISATTIKEGPYQSGKVAMHLGRKGTQRNSDTPSESATGGLAAGLVVGILLILLFLILAFLIWKRKRIYKERYERTGSLPLASVDYSPSSATDNINFVNANTETKTAQALAPSLLSTEIQRHRSSRLSSRSASFKPAKPPVDFPAPDLSKLKKEFKSVPVEQRFLDCKEGSKSANKAKNRYKNIIAYDHSLVSLEWVYGEMESFYINANFIHGYDGSPEVYIATQGPLNITVNDFWRMIWEQKVSSIVMLTNLQELGKIKCYQYWPDNCSQYSDITITNHKTEVFADFTIRTFFMSKAGSQNRRVRQFHFTAWPDKGVPDHATAVLSFRRKVLTLTSGNDGDSPTVVHCSAGVGRTGTYIMIDAMLRQAEDQRFVDILTYLKTIRNDRPYMVQTVEQYIFVNMAIYDALSCGNTEVPVQNLVYALQQLSIVNRRHKVTGYAQEFQRLDDVTSEDTQSGNFDVGLSRKNVKKNRYSDIVAANANRVILSTVDDTEIGDYINYSVIAAFKERKGDYINASFVDTYREHNAFIMTQAPMENTIADFWRMVMDYKIGSIVMLNNLEEQCEIFPQYWPLHESKTYEGNKVRLVETKHLPGNIVLRILEVSNRRKQLTVNHFQHLTWENKDVPTNPQSVLRLLHEVQKSQQKSGNSPIVVQCNNGVGRSGTLCAIASCLERVKQEQVLDVFQTIKSIRVNRPGAVETLPQYVFCYTIIQKYLDSFRDYANFGDI